MSQQLSRRLGAQYLGQRRCQFLVWAPRAERVEVDLVAPYPHRQEMQRLEWGYYGGVVEGIEPGALYRYRLNGSDSFPDPASRFQPEGVHGPSQVLPAQWPWTDQQWRGMPLREYIIYEIHVGTFTPEGTFQAAIERLPYLKELGVTAIELMPVAQFPGERNWGYDGAYLFAPQASYGGADGLHQLIDACHKHGLAVVMDVVYNHLGPEGNYLGQFGFYFTQKYRTPWGSAINFDGPHSDHVREFFIQNALFWIGEMHVDALRLDAVHAIYDESARPFLRELADAVRLEAELLNRRIYIIAESNKNDIRHVQPAQMGGFGLDSQWNDDFHHSVHALLTGEHNGYYGDFGTLDALAKAYREGFAYTGQRSSYRGRRHGVSSWQLPASNFCVFVQNHDQVGNRLHGERLGTIVSFEQQKLAAGLVLLSPYVPLLFMGEEYGETAPFLYFISHIDPELVEAVRRGRSDEFLAFAWEGQIPDPQSEQTFGKCRLQFELRHHQRHRQLWELYQRMIRLRKTSPALVRGGKHDMDVVVHHADRALRVRRYYGEDEVQMVFHLGSEPLEMTVPLPSGSWSLEINSASGRWGGPGHELAEEIVSDGAVQFPLAPQSFVMLSRQHQPF